MASLRTEQVDARAVIIAAAGNAMAAKDRRKAFVATLRRRNASRRCGGVARICAVAHELNQLAAMV